MRTQEVLNKMPETVLRRLREYKAEYEEGAERTITRHTIRAYLNGMMDAGFITESERKTLFAWATL